MTQYIIPDQFLPGLESLNSMSIEEISKIADALSSLPVGAGPKTTIERLSMTVPVNGINAAANTIFSFGSLLSSTSQFDVTEIGNSIAQSFADEHESPVNIEELSKKLAVVLTACGNLKK